MRNSMNFKAILFLSTCLYCHFSLYADPSQQLFPWMEADAASNVIEEQIYDNGQGEDQIKTFCHSNDLNLRANAENQFTSLDSISVSQSNIAPSGTAYSWSGMTSSTAIMGQVAQPG